MIIISLVIVMVFMVKGTILMKILKMIMIIHKTNPFVFNVNELDFFVECSNRSLFSEFLWILAFCFLYFISSTHLFLFSPRINAIGAGRKAEERGRRMWTKVWIWREMDLLFQIFLGRLFWISFFYFMFFFLCYVFFLSFFTRKEKLCLILHFFPVILSMIDGIWEKFVRNC